MTNDDMSLYINQTKKYFKTPVCIAGGITENNVISNIAIGNKKCGSLWRKQHGNFYLKKKFNAWERGTSVILLTIKKFKNFLKIKILEKKVLILHRSFDPAILPLRIFSIQIKTLVCKNIYKGFFFAVFLVVTKVGNKVNGNQSCSG